MNWIDLNHRSPRSTGAYIISVEVNSESIPYVFSYVAYFCKDENVWYKYDPFNDNPKGDEITERILGWIEDFPSFA